VKTQTEVQILLNRIQARKLNLSGPDEYWNGWSADLAKICNGYGPDRWPEEARDILTWIYRNMEISSQIHDVRYELSDGTEEGRKIADDEMLDNMRKEVAAAYPLWKVWRWGRRGLEMAKADAAWFALRQWGEEAWMSAYHKRVGVDQPDVT